VNPGGSSPKKNKGVGTIKKSTRDSEKGETGRVTGEGVLRSEIESIARTGKKEGGGGGCGGSTLKEPRDI